MISSSFLDNFTSLFLRMMFLHRLFRTIFDHLLKMIFLSFKKDDFSLLFQEIMILLSKKDNFSSLFLGIMILLSKKNDFSLLFSRKMISLSFLDDFTSSFLGTIIKKSSLRNNEKKIILNG